MAGFEQKPNSGSIFNNERKEQDSHPDRTGSCNIDGRDYWVNGWLKKTKDGKPYLSLSFKLKEARGQGGGGQGGGGRQQQAPQRSQQSYDDQRGGGRGGGDGRHSRDYDKPIVDDSIPFSWLIGAISVASLAYSIAGVGGGII